MEFLASKVADAHRCRAICKEALDIVVSFGAAVGTLQIFEHLFVRDVVKGALDVDGENSRFVMAV